MKKIVLIAICSTLSLTALAQSWDQSRMFSENLYGGTARSVAMGNALTAVGGDIGSVGINPAGSSVAGYTQFVITPGVSISSTVSQGMAQAGMAPLGYGDRCTEGFARMKLPNMGLTLSMNTGRKHGLKRVSVGFLSNSTNDYTYRMTASGTNYGKNSYSGSLATLGNGYAPELLKAYTTSDWFATGPAWEAMAGYMSGIFDQVGDTYLGISDILVNGKPEAAKPLYQRYGNQTIGYKHDMVVNVSFNFEDKFYIGANLGVVAMNYSQSEFWEERPDDPSTFPDIVYDGGAKVARFNSLHTQRRFDTQGSGIYFKMGALWRPIAGLRLGAAIQTPTLVNMTSRCAWYAETNITGAYFSPCQSPDDEWTYSLSLPFRWNVGAAYTLGSVAVVSVDYEMADYSHSRYRGRIQNGWPTGVWANQNADIQDILGLAHNLRVGLEVKPHPAFAIRAGYNLLTSGQKNWLNYDLSVTPLTSDERASQNTHLASLGFGYAGNYFFADIAVRLRFRPQDYYVPYSHYTYDTDYTAKYVDLTAEVPEVEVSAMGIQTLLTLGWRF